MLIVSFLMIFIGVGLMMLSVGSGSLTGGALIFIGPIPIVFGQDTGGRALMAVGGLVAFMLIALWLWNMKHQIEIA